jgi:hypothetical protein
MNAFKSASARLVTNAAAATDAGKRTLANTATVRPQQHLSSTRPSGPATKNSIRADSASRARIGEGADESGGRNPSQPRPKKKRNA